ncbi:MAG: hypothetical protein EA377_12635 [Phycisphaerales bacterium]|nr:MAG: hypothetical protein EA377_12635 [Phycisphaerales bacterium]
MQWCLLTQRRVMVRSMILMVVMMFALAALAGCSRAEAESSDAEETEISIRFPTADSLVAHLNTLLTETPIDYLGVLDLYYPENDLQRELLDLERLMHPLVELEHQGFRQFGESILETGQRDPLSGVPPVIIEHDDHRRARGTATDYNHQEFELHLVQMDQEWYISGYTTEYMFMGERDPATIASKLRPRVEMLLPAVNAVLPRLRNGEFRTAQEAKQSLALHMMSGN